MKRIRPSAANSQSILSAAPTPLVPTSLVHVPPCCLARAIAPNSVRGAPCLLGSREIGQHVAPFHTCTYSSSHLKIQSSPKPRLLRSLAVYPSSRRFIRIRTSSSADTAATSSSSTDKSAESTNCPDCGHQRQRQHEQSSASCDKFGSHPKCWSCDNFVKGISLFCSCCQKVQPPANYDYFELLGMPKKFSVDVSKLEKHYWALQRKLHPDNFHTASFRERTYSEGVSSIINEAYHTLKHPNRRAKYMMRLMGVPLDESAGTITDPDLLMEIMETRMRLEDADDAEVRALDAENKQRLGACYDEIGRSLDASNIEQCRQVAVRLQYYVKIEEEIKKRKRLE